MGICNRFLFKISLLIIGLVGLGGIVIGIFGLTNTVIGDFSVAGPVSVLALISGGVLFVAAKIGYISVRGLNTRRILMFIFLGLLIAVLLIYIVAAALTLSAASGIPNCDPSKDVCQDMPPEVEVQLEAIWVGLPVDARAQLKVSLNCGSQSDLDRVAANNAKVQGMYDSLKASARSALEKGKEISSSLADKAKAQMSSLNGMISNSTMGGWMSDLGSSLSSLGDKLQNLSFVQNLEDQLDAKLAQLDNQTWIDLQGWNSSVVDGMKTSLTDARNSLQSSIGSVTNITVNATLEVSEEIAFQACKDNLAKEMKGSMQVIAYVLAGFAFVLILATATGFSICCGKDEVEDW
jgi:hypothetical protein